MNISERLNQLPPQDRAHIIGTIEYIQEQWVLFDEHDEPNDFMEFSGQPFDIWIHSNWVPFHEFDEGMAYGKTTYTIKNGDKVRISKPLPFVYQEWLNELTDDTLEKFARTLNDTGYSIYDCIYCHNFLFFQIAKKGAKGVNFLMFDNDDQVCNIQHFFERIGKQSDRFEITLNNGNRKLLTTL
ncbi:DUF2777 family protein [Bacillus suaedaesalsae]|uniref:DUF2777 family protein n=1 Tax=Bacillus suaedaesalsae TaxID=2810349 RepID=A0ABS2DF74_9BACI|nr:DUF2777 family protein [Bacillus suaedaesalsae]MBM6617119.1 DUF2777 family protein [Bacillus suaedaesalsae]